MHRVGFLLASLLVLGALVCGQEKHPPAAPAEFKIPDEDVKRENPVKPTPAGLEAAKRIYKTDCLICHGVDGDGKGELAPELKTKILDWREPATLEKLTDGALFYIITNGKGEMPGEVGRMKPEQCWQLVNYVRTFPRKDAAAKKPAKPQ